MILMILCEFKDVNCYDLILNSLQIYLIWDLGIYIFYLKSPLKYMILLKF